METERIASKFWGQSGSRQKLRAGLNPEINYWTGQSEEVGACGLWSPSVKSGQPQDAYPDATVRKRLVD
jgi:hypothetical protein